MKKPVISIAVIIAFLTPYISVVSGLVVTYLFVHLQWLNIFHINQTGTIQAVAGLVIFAITSGLTYAAAHWHWLPVVIEKLERRDAVAASPSVTGTSAGTGASPVK